MLLLICVTWHRKAKRCLSKQETEVMNCCVSASEHSAVSGRIIRVGVLQNESEAQSFKVQNFSGVALTIYLSTIKMQLPEP